MLKVGEVDYSNALQSNVICVEDDYYNDIYMVVLVVVLIINILAV